MEQRSALIYLQRQPKTVPMQTLCPICPYIINFMASPNLLVDIFLVSLLTLPITPF